MKSITELKDDVIRSKAQGTPQTETANKQTNNKTAVHLELSP